MRVVKYPVMLKILLVACFLTLSTSAHYSGYQTWHVVISDVEQIQTLHELQDEALLDIWKSAHGIGDFAEVMVSPSQISAVHQALQSRGATYTVHLSNVGKYLDSSSPSRRVQRNALPGKGPSLASFHSEYHDLEEIYQFLDSVALLQPSLCSVITYGRTSLGQPLKLLRVSRSPARVTDVTSSPRLVKSLASSRRAVWVDGGIHAREWISPASVLYLLHQFLSNDELVRMTSHLDLYFTPVLNPDGYNFTWTSDRLWRKNRRPSPGPYLACQTRGDEVGVDLNRNFGYQWRAGTNKCSFTYPGDTAFSEPETRAVRDFISGLGNAEVYISYHAAAQVVLAPWCYTDEEAPHAKQRDEVGVQAVSKMSSAVDGRIFKYGQPATVMNTVASGTSLDWALGGGNVTYSYVVELRSPPNSELDSLVRFAPPAASIVPSATEALAFFTEVIGHVASKSRDMSHVTPTSGTAIHITAIPFLIYLCSFYLLLLK